MTGLLLMEKLCTKFQTNRLPYLWHTQRDRLFRFYVAVELSHPAAPCINVVLPVGAIIRFLGLTLSHVTQRATPNT